MFLWKGEAKSRAAVKNRCFHSRIGAVTSVPLPGLAIVDRSTRDAALARLSTRLDSPRLASPRTGARKRGEKKKCGEEEKYSQIYQSDESRRQV